MFKTIPTRPDFVAEIQGLDLRGGVTDAEYQALEEALARYGVLAVRCAHPMTDDDQEALITRFGPPVMSVLNEKKVQPDRPHFLDIATVDENDRPLVKGSFTDLYNLANQLWHTDGTQVQPPIRVSMLSARVLPPVPPDTQYADMRAAWDALPGLKKQEIDSLQVVHSIFTSRAKVGLTEFTPAAASARPPVVHPLVRTHPRTGRKSLYLASHASHVVGWPQEQGEALLRELTDFATQERFVYAHQWREHDFLIWDDSFTMHRATPYAEPHPRKMRWSGARELEAV